MSVDISWAKVDLQEVPHFVTPEIPARARRSSMPVKPKPGF